MKVKGEQNIKGITLIALVITIIVLLILVGVTISTLTGNNGILSKASIAKNETSKATAKEKLGLLLTDFKIEAYSYGVEPTIDEEEMEYFAEYLGEKDEVDNATYTNGKILVVIGGEQFFVDNNLNIQDITEGEIASKIQVDIVDGACLRFSSANPEAYSKKENNKKVAAIGDTKISAETENMDCLVQICLPNGESGVLDLSDENSMVEYWAYKSKEYEFILVNNNGETDSLNVDVEIPYTPEEYLNIESGKAELKDAYSYYIGCGRRENHEEKHGEQYPYNIINLPNNLSYENLEKFAINGITTYIFSEADTTLFPGIGYGSNKGQGKDIKTIYVPATVTEIGEYAFYGLTESTTIYFEVSAPLDTWNEKWNKNCGAKILWNQ